VDRQVTMATTQPLPCTHVELDDREVLYGLNADASVDHQTREALTVDEDHACVHDAA
jgi:hypothetical protein